MEQLQVYYHSHILKTRLCYADMYEYILRLQTASEDGYEDTCDVRVVGTENDLKQMQDFWATHGASVMPFLMGMDQPAYIDDTCPF